MRHPHLPRRPSERRQSVRAWPSPSGPQAARSSCSCRPRRRGPAPICRSTTTVPPLEEEFSMERRDDGTDAVVRLHGCIPDDETSEDAVVDERCGPNLSDEEGAESDDEDESDEELYDGDDDEAVDPLLQLARRRNFVPEGRFLGPPRYASAGSTAGYMRVTAVGSQQGDKQILVLYRYTRFSMAPDGREGDVQARGGTREHQARFIVPAAGNAATSLPWVGSLLVWLIYPVRSSKRLQELWSSLISAVKIPAQATRLQVIVDVGILRRADYTPARMEQVHAALKGMVSAPWPSYHFGMKLHLPEPVPCAGGKTGERPAKCMRFAGQECPVCLELLESDPAAAWPRCSHVFHGACLELILKTSEMCPMCRRTLSAPLDERESLNK